MWPSVLNARFEDLACGFWEEVSGEVLVLKTPCKICQQESPTRVQRLTTKVPYKSIPQERKSVLQKCPNVSQECPTRVPYKSVFVNAVQNVAQKRVSGKSGPTRGSHLCLARVCRTSCVAPACCTKQRFGRWCWRPCVGIRRWTKPECTFMPKEVKGSHEKNLPANTSPETPCRNAVWSLQLATVHWWRLSKSVFGPLSSFIALHLNSHDGVCVIPDAFLAPV